MKLSFLFSIAAILCVSATTESYSQTVKISLNLSEATVEKALDVIKQQSEYSFWYRNEDIKLDKKISVSTDNQLINSVLDKVLAGQNLSYIIDNKHVIIYKTPASVERKNTLQAGIKVAGTVIDETNVPMPGVNVSVKGTTTGVVTDADGKYSIMVPDNNTTLIFSFIGYKTREFVVGAQTEINLTLEEDTHQIEEVVVVGYGTRVKGTLTGSITKTDSKTFETRPVVNAVNALQGAMPGVSVIRGATKPGYDQTEIQVRGYSSMSEKTKPLILIDGIAGDLFMLNPNDIENVTVLKDAAASIYGARASDGVILVTTKKGKAGKPRLSYSGNFGIKMPHFLKEMTTTSQLIDMYNESKTNLGLPLASQDVVNKIKAGNTPPDPNGGWLAGLETYPGFYEYFDWTDMIIGNGTQQNHDISVSGGSENSTYLFSVGYNRDEGIFKYGDPAVSNRYNIAANNSFKNIFNRLDIETRIQYDSRRTNEPTQTDGVLEHMTKLWRFLPMYNPDGSFYMWQGFANPANLLVNGGRRTIRNDRMTFNAKADLKIVEGLKLVGQYGVSIAQIEVKTENPTFYSYDWKNNITRTDNSPNSVAYGTTDDNKDPSFRRYSSYTAYLEYNKTLWDMHHLNVMVGAAHEENDDDRKQLSGSNLLSNDLFSLNLSDKTDIKYLTANTYASDWALTSFFGRLGYNFDMRYLVDFTLRADGSSKFASDKRWSAIFPAVSAAWNIGEESFMKSQDLFELLKLRASWGQSGNQELNFGNYDYIPLIEIKNDTYPFGTPGVNATGATATIASQERTWETITTYNAGVDFTLLESRLSGSFEVYLRKNDNMLVAQELPALLGGTAPTQNIGELETKGFELMLGWRDKISDFSYGVSVMLSDSKNKLVKLKGSDVKGEGLQKVREGYSMYSYFGYASDGIIRTDEQLAEYKKMGGTVPTRIGLGDMMYRDVDGDDKITAFGDDGKSGDLVYLGNALPRYTYSSNIDLSYKNIDFSVFLQGVGKRNVVRTGDFQAPFQNWWFQPLAYFHGKTWTADRPDAEVPRITEGSRGWDDIRNWNYRYSDSPHRLNNAAYLRVKLITLAYRLPQSFCDKLKIQSIRVYASGQDLFTFAKGTWDRSFDPEEGWLRYDAYTYPFTKTISFGLDVKF